MKKEKLLALLGEMDDEWILEAMQPAPGRRGRAASLDGMERIADEERKARLAAKMDDAHGSCAAMADGEYRVSSAAEDGARQGGAAAGNGERRDFAAAADSERLSRAAMADGEYRVSAVTEDGARQGSAAAGNGERRDFAAAADSERLSRAARADGEHRVSAAAEDGARQGGAAADGGQRVPAVPKVGERRSFTVTVNGAWQGRAAAANDGQRVSAAKVSGAHHSRRVRTVLLAAALLLALAGAAMAAARSGLLDALFARARIEPNPAAREALVVNDAGAATDGYGYEIAESLRDGRMLYLNVSAENESGETLIFCGPFLTGGILPLDEHCGMVLGGEAAQRAGDSLRYELPEDAPDDLSATATVYVLRPTARMINTDDSSEVNVQGEPLILWERNESRLDGWYDGYLREKDGSERLGGEGFTFGGMRTEYSFDDSLTKELAEAEGGEAMVQALCEHGYVEKLDALTFPVSFRDGGTAVEYAAAQPEAELSDGRVSFLRLSVSPVESRLEFELIQSGDALEAPMFALYVDGERITDAICGQRPRFSSEGIDFSSVPTGEHDYSVTWTSRADPPAEIRLVPMENLAEERPDEAVVWRVQAAE